LTWVQRRRRDHLILLPSTEERQVRLALVRVEEEADVRPWE
jgi:hypothetical protein